MNRYMARHYETGETDEFVTIKDAQIWLRDMEYGEGGSSASAGEEIGYIAEILQRAIIVEADNIKNYPCLKNPDNPAICSDCTDNPDCEGTEEWPYSTEYEWVYDIKFKEQKGGD